MTQQTPTWENLQQFNTFDYFSLVFATVTEHLEHCPAVHFYSVFYHVRFVVLQMVYHIV